MRRIEKTAQTLLANFNSTKNHFIPKVSTTTLFIATSNKQIDIKKRKEITELQKVWDIFQLLQIARFNIWQAANLEDKEAWEQYIYVLNTLLWYAPCEDYIKQVFYIRNTDKIITDSTYKNNVLKWNDTNYNKIIPLQDRLLTEDLKRQLQPLKEKVNLIKHRLPILPNNKEFSWGVMTAHKSENSVLGIEFETDSILSTDGLKYKVPMEELLTIIENSDKAINQFLVKYIIPKWEHYNEADS